MKKIIVVPLVAVVAAAGAASAAGFAGGVSAGPLQVGQTSDLECARSAEVVEWGYDDSGAEAGFPAVVNVKVELRGAQCSDQALNVIQIDEDGKQSGPRAGGRIPAQPQGVQTVRLSFDAPVDAESLESIRISIDPGYANQPYGTIN